jgi:hypothetical protein
MGEWLSLPAILEYDFLTLEADLGGAGEPSLVPFAMSPGGDPYCWYPARTVAGEAVVCYCEYGEFDRIQPVAPSLLGFVYRNALEQLSVDCGAGEERTARHNLARWRATWFPLFPQPWQQTLAAIPEVVGVEWVRTLPSGYQERGRSFLHPDEVERIVARDLHFAGIDQTVAL